MCSVLQNVQDSRSFRRDARIRKNDVWNRSKWKRREQFLVRVIIDSCGPRCKRLGTKEADRDIGHIPGYTKTRGWASLSLYPFHSLLADFSLTLLCLTFSATLDHPRYCFDAICNACCIPWTKSSSSQPNSSGDQPKKNSFAISESRERRSQPGHFIKRVNEDKKGKLPHYSCSLDIITVTFIKEARRQFYPSQMSYHVKEIRNSQKSTLYYF